MSDTLPDGHMPVSKPRVGVLLLNLGTPDATDYWSVRAYLKEFLSDHRVIEMPRLLWWFILNFLVLTFRPSKSGAAYDKIWDKSANDSPLRIISLSQAMKLQARLGNDVMVDVAMRYGNPSTEARLRAMQEAGCGRILLVPLYPQYSATTTATANDKAFDVLKQMRWQPAIRTAPAYFADASYIEALANSIKEGVEALDFEPDLVVTSYHGMPQSYLQKGDPYYHQCLETTRLVGKKLGWAPDKLLVAFQSRFGREEWLKPYLDETLRELPGKGVKKIAVIAPAFSVDCLETLEELAIAGSEIFMAHGGAQFGYINCLNDSDGGMDAIEGLVRRELSGWV